MTGGVTGQLSGQASVTSSNVYAAIGSLIAFILPFDRKRCFLPHKALACLEIKLLMEYASEVLAMTIHTDNLFNSKTYAFVIRP